MSAPSQTRRFAPLKLGNTQDEAEGKLVLKGVVFDVDGTLCKFLLLLVALSVLFLSSQSAMEDLRLGEEWTIMVIAVEYRGRRACDR